MIVIRYLCFIYEKETTEASCWNLGYDDNYTDEYYSLAPNEILSIWDGIYYFEDGAKIHHGCNPILLSLDNDSIIPDVIELQCMDRVIKGKVNNVPRKMKYVKDFYVE